MDRRVNACADNREDGHRLGGAGDREAPPLASQEEHRRDEGTGVGHRNPEDEVGDVPGPECRAVRSPDADTRHDHVEDAGKASGGEGSRDGDGSVPPERGLPLDDGTNRIGHPERAAVVKHLRRTGDGAQVGRHSLVGGGGGHDRIRRAHRGWLRRRARLPASRGWDCGRGPYRRRADGC